jgi:hypothetical protein
MVRVRIIEEGARFDGVQPGLGVPTHPDQWPACYGPWRPYAVLGAPAPGGLLLPPAHPSASTLYAPRGVWLDDERVIAVDTGNHRVLIWHGAPETDGVAADVVLGQPDDLSEGPGAGLARMHLPCGVLVDPAGRLVVADAWNHRILVWDQVPAVTGTPADHVIGQVDGDQVSPNAGGDARGDTFYWPFGVALIDGRFHVADTGNRRVLIWRDGIPLDGRSADVVLGQPDSTSRDENRGGPAGAASFRWPHTVTPDGRGGIVIADAGNHRLLGWAAPPETDVPADWVFGQADVAGSTENPYRQHDGRELRFPYAAVGLPGGGLAGADTADNRILVFETCPSGPGDHPDHVLAQPHFGAIGENRWELVALDTLCWPYGLAAHGDRLAVADSGNNRVVLWRRS